MEGIKLPLDENLWDALQVRQFLYAVLVQWFTFS
jgi:hypothetical protein